MPHTIVLPIEEDGVFLRALGDDFASKQSPLAQNVFESSSEKVAGCVWSSEFFVRI